ncbi:MAG: hypothetical protein Q9198_003627 [Flavoplaca austrocitrina]
MPRKGWIDKENATTFALVHRPQNDPRIHDASSSSMVFQELAPSQARKIKTLTDLESELFQNTDHTSTQPAVRDNEGEAAEYGVYYDDTGYDYMQHLRDLNDQKSQVESCFVDAPVSRKDAKGKQKMSLEDALREISLDGNTSTQQLLGEDILPSRDLKQRTYQDQQDIPDVLAGFQPDMDPRLREALAALEDDAYVDDEEGLFGELTRDGEVSLEEFKISGVAGDDNAAEGDGWETDDTVKPANECKIPSISPISYADGDVPMSDGTDHGDGDWMKEFSKFKTAEKKARATAPNAKVPDLQSSIVAGSSMTDGRHKKRKGAMTSSTGYSMTSSSLLRTEGQTLQDSRFDKVLEDYEEDLDEGDDGASVMTGSSILSRPSSVASSQAPPSLRSDFDSIMDEFLGNYSMTGKKRVKKGRYQSGLDQLDEVRRELGPAKLKSSQQKA